MDGYNTGLDSLTTHILHITKTEKGYKIKTAHNRNLVGTEGKKSEVGS